MIDLNKQSLILIKHENYREFLKEALVYLGFSGKRINYAAFSRKAGFSSRSYPRDVVVGKRRMTIQSLPKFIRGMGLRGDLKNFFILLAAKEEDLNSTHLAAFEIPLHLKKIRQRLQTKALPAKIPFADLAKYKYWQDIFASLGDPETGANILEVAARTGLPVSNCQTILKNMCANGSAEYLTETDKYRGCTLNLNLDGLGREILFRNHLQSRLQKINSAVNTHLNSSDRLFFDSVWSVQKSKMPEFKQELRKVILQFVESTEESNADSLAHLFVSLGPISDLR